MNNIGFLRETFSRLFVIAVNNKMNLSSFSYQLERSEFIKKIEDGKYDDYFNKSLISIFNDITGITINDDSSYGVYNDAYWCGYSYFEIFLRTKKPFSYILLKLPLVKMMDIYPIYHEMDISSLLDLFAKQEQEKTILRALCEHSKVSLPKLSAATGIGLATLSKYNADDKALYNASFQNIIQIAHYFNVPINMFAIKLQ